jgi:hypothetical protein
MDSNRFDHRGHALRKGRVSEPGRVYLLTAVTLNRKPHFQGLDIGSFGRLRNETAARSR